jgi:seryl-tRNA synthetase
MNTDKSHCPSCGTLYVKHKGLIATCHDLLEAQRWQESLLKSNAEIEAERNIWMNADRDTRIATGYKRDPRPMSECAQELVTEFIKVESERDQWKERAEAAEAEVERLNEELRANIEIGNRNIKRAEAAETELKCWEDAESHAAQQLAEVREERDRLKSLVTDCEALRLMTDERDRYKAELLRIANDYSHTLPVRCLAREALEMKP